MRKIFRTLNESLAGTAANKSAAAAARRANVLAEAPSAAIQDGCRVMAAALAADGFVFAASGPRFSRKNGDWRHEISVQSDHNNAAGARAAIWLHASITSTAFSKWREHRGLALGTKGRVIAQLGNLSTPPCMMEWNFVDATIREATAKDAVQAIRTLAFPLFPKVECLDELISRLETGGDYDPVISIDTAVELALWHRGRDSAEAIGRAFLARHSGQQELFERRRAYLTANGLPSRRGYQDLGFLALKENLNFNGK